MQCTKINKKSLLSSIIAVLICISAIVSASTIPVEAKAAPKLTAKSVTIAMGGSQTIKLYNAEQGKWVLRSNGVARIKKRSRKNVTVVPLKAGTTTLTCKVGRKTLKCKVKVLNNSIGGVEDMYFPAVIVGKSFTHRFTLPEGVTYKGNEFDEKTGKLTVKTASDKDTGRTAVTMTVKAVRPGRFKSFFYYQEGEKTVYEPVDFVFINGFRGKTRASKTDANYDAWRKKTISSMVKADMSTWEIINAIGCLISSGKYSSKGGATGKQLWYGGNGTCVSGAKMMKDFMDDLGIKSSIHFMGGKGISKDIYGAYIGYASQHKNTWVTLGGKRYELNAQPGAMWPRGTVER